MNKNILVVVLLLIIIGSMAWLAYVYLFPKPAGASSARVSEPMQQVEFILKKKVSTSDISIGSFSNDPFSSLILKLNQPDLSALLKGTDGVGADKRIVYISGAKSSVMSIATLSINRNVQTFDLDRGNSKFSFNGKEYVIVYFNPDLEGLVAMELSSGRLYVIKSQGMIMN